MVVDNSQPVDGLWISTRTTALVGTLRSMTVRGEIPNTLKHSPGLALSSARALGITAAQWRHPELARPFHGVAARDHGQLTQRQLAVAYALRMPEAQFFSHITAAVLYGVPLPRELELAQLVHVSATAGGGIPRARGVQGHHAAWDRKPERFGTFMLSAPADVWCELWRELCIEDLVAAGDYLVTGDEPYSGEPPLIGLDELRRTVRAYGSRRGAKKLRAALELVRYGALSRMETKTRLLLIRDGLPEPELNYSVFDEAGTRVAMLDIAYPEFKVVIEYQSDYHRDGVQFRKDVTRRELLEDLAWTVIYVSKDDVNKRPHETLARVRRRLRARGAPF